LSPDQPPVFLAEVPAFMRDAPGPRPDGIQIDFQQLFGAAEDTSGSGGLYVLVKDGIVVLVQGERILELDRGESAFAGFVPGQFYRLASPPPVLQLLENQLPPATSAGSLICTF
jgi:hypothetical protein